MLYGRRLDEALEHVSGSRYALVHAVAKRARQITLWLTADPAELRAESAPPPAPGELVSRDPVALSEAEILQGEVGVRWDPEGLDDGVGSEEFVETDPLLIEGIADDDDDVDVDAALESGMTPALAQALEGEVEDGDALADEDADDSDDDVDLEADDEELVPDIEDEDADEVEVELDVEVDDEEEEAEEV
jgi:DNA-directed RNA polymerase omega subunit